MKTGLLDVNMLIALTWPSHVHHGLAQEGFARFAKSGWATCPLTQSAFVRISSNAKIIPEAVTPGEALALLGRMVRVKGHTFWKDEIDMLSRSVPSSLLVGHRQVTDAYLLGLAIHQGGCLVTLDAGIADLLPSSSPHRDALCVVQADENVKNA